MSADIFISYSRRASGDQVASIRHALSERGLSVFLDTRDIDYGDVFPERIADGLLESKVVLVVFDDGYFERQWCAYEFQVAVAATSSRYRNAHTLRTEGRCRHSKMT